MQRVRSKAVAATSVLGLILLGASAPAADAIPMPAGDPCNYSTNFYCGSTAGVYFNGVYVTATHVYGRDTASAAIQKGVGAYNTAGHAIGSVYGSADTLVSTFPRQSAKPYCSFQTSGEIVGCNWTNA